MLLSTPRNFTPGATPEEQLKVTKDGLDVIQDLYRYAESGFSTITEDDFTRFKWYGFYRQKPKDSGYFMLRLRLPGGRLNAAQMDVLAGIADDYAHGFCDVTTRQTFQYHWLTIEQAPDIFARLDAVGISTSGACGDIARNVVGCPVAGIDKDEIIDATPQLMQINEHLLNNREFSNLPRKYKISISGCRIHCAQPDINCLGFFGLERTVNGKVEAGFGMKIGGGLSSAPHLAQTLPIFLRPDQVLPAAHYASVLYRDYGIREKRSRARLKFLVADWGAEKILAKIEELGNLKFDRHSDFVFPTDPETDHIGVREQKQAGLWYVGVCFAGGRVRGHQLRKLGELARKYAAPGQDSLGATNKQNIILFNIPEKNVEALKAELDANELVWNPSNFRQGCVSCTGIEFCNLAIAETKNRMMELVGQLETECQDYKGKIRIHFSGCPSSCGQHQIADIGFRGGLTKINGVSTECFDMFIGGKLGDKARFNELIKGKIPSTQIHKTIGTLLRFYEAKKLPNELFADFAKRLPKDEIKAALEPAVAAV
jgi:ferredoxin-nitrite reductase